MWFDIEFSLDNSYIDESEKNNRTIFFND